MKSKKLDELLKSLQQCREMATTDYAGWDWRTRPGMEVAKSQARRDLVDLTWKYQLELVKTVAKVFVTGDHDKVVKLASLLTKEGAFTIPSASMYEQLADMVAPTLSSGNAFSSPSYIRLIELVTEMAVNNRVDSSGPMEDPKFIGINNRQDLVDVIKKTVRSGFGDNLMKAFVINNFLEHAIKNSFNQQMSILVISGLSEQEKASLMDSIFPGQPSFELIIQKDEEVDKSMALKVYRRVSETFYKLGKLVKEDEVSVEAKVTETKIETN